MLPPKTNPSTGAGSQKKFTPNFELVTEKQELVPLAASVPARIFSSSIGSHATNSSAAAAASLSAPEPSASHSADLVTDAALSQAAVIDNDPAEAESS